MVMPRICRYPLFVVRWARGVAQLNRDNCGFPHSPVSFYNCGGFYQIDKNRVILLTCDLSQACSDLQSSNPNNCLRTFPQQVRKLAHTALAEVVSSSSELSHKEAQKAQKLAEILLCLLWPFVAERVLRQLVSG